MRDISEFPNPIAYAFEAAGGIGAAAKACGVTYQALNKWRLASCLPRTDYTGETTYADQLADAAKSNGNAFEASWLRQACAPLKNTE